MTRMTRPDCARGREWRSVDKYRLGAGTRAGARIVAEMGTWDEDGNGNGKEDRIWEVGRKSKKRKKWGNSCRSHVEKERIGSVEKKGLVQ